MNKSLYIDKRRNIWPKVYSLGFTVLFLIYDFLFILGFIICLPVYIWRRKISILGLREKLGFIRNIEGGKTIWIQVVSVGEVNAIDNFIRRLKRQSNYSLVVSTTTLTGNVIARRKYSHLAKVIFFPLDISFIVKKVIKIINPQIFIAVETEIWPNLFRNLSKRNIPIVIVNGRISDKAFRRYRLIKPVIRKILNRCSSIGVQNENYKKRFLSLGADKQRIILSGNMKFESISIDQNSLRKIKETYIPILKKENKFLFVSGCTHPGEEEIILSVYKDIFADFSDIILLLAPRHPERISSIEKIVRAKGFNPIRISKASDGSFFDKKNVYLLDTIGELLYFYSLADICFVGGSLSNNGGHNILEPIYFLKPTLFGPHMDNFPDVEETVLEKGAGIKIRDADELKEILLRLIKDKALRDNLSNKCREVFEKEKTSLDKNLQIISNYIK